jgi:menaquinol-cytochrome c reductase cytochrome b subunit
LLIVILMGATGYLLRWDIKAFALTDLIVSNFSDIPLLGQAVVVAMLGGSDLETVPLYGGFAYHVWIIPLFLGSTLTLHLLVAWRQGLPILWLCR